MQFNAHFPPPAVAPRLDVVNPEVSALVFHLARTGDAEGLAHLIEAGLPAHLRDEEGDSLLLLACEGGHRATAALLLENGADPGLANFSGRTPLAAAASTGDAALVRLLMEHGAVQRLDS
jgi:ankyrin repeat protein